MTEPDVASSDPLALQTTAIRSGDECVINGDPKTMECISPEAIQQFSCWAAVVPWASH